MSWTLFTKIIDEIAAEAPTSRVWLVFFGEPFIRTTKQPTIFDMIHYAKRRGLTDVVLNTNGYLLNSVNRRALLDVGLDAIYVGIDAATPETYAKLRVGSNYERVRRNVLDLLALKQRWGAPLRVFVQFVEMEENRSERDAFVALWTDSGASVKVRPMVSWAGRIDVPRGEEPARWPCHWAMQTMSITDRGHVVTCAVDLDAAHVAGDVTKNTLKEVWNGPLRALREHHASQRYDLLPPHCRDCHDWQGAQADYYDALGAM